MCCCKNESEGSRYFRRHLLNFRDVQSSGGRGNAACWINVGRAAELGYILSGSTVDAQQRCHRVYDLLWDVL